jgi:hypothetical protein
MASPLLAILTSKMKEKPSEDEADEKQEETDKVDSGELESIAEDIIEAIRNDSKEDLAEALRDLIDTHA